MSVRRGCLLHEIIDYSLTCTLHLSVIHQETTRHGPQVKNDWLTSDATVIINHNPSVAKTAAISVCLHN